jgi:hypothetical protein
MMGKNLKSWNSMTQMRLSLLETLNLAYLIKLTNDLVLHYPNSPLVPTKFPSNIPKFEGKDGEDPTNHVMIFHLWCSSTYLMDYSIRFRLFQCTLTIVEIKWYIKLT